MSGELVGLVLKHGPEDHNAAVVLVVIAEDMHHAADTALLDLTDLATRARLGRSTVVRAVKTLREDGWVTCWPGRGRGMASRYQLRSERFSTGANKVPERAPLDSDKRSRSGHANTQKVPAQVVKVPGAGLSTVTVETPSSSPTSDDHLPGVLASVRDDDDDALRTALDGLPPVRRSHVLRRTFTAALASGHTPATVNAYLRAHVRPDRCDDLHAVVVVNLRDMPPVVAPPAPRAPCADCDGSGWVDPDADALAPCPSCRPSRAGATHHNGAKTAPPVTLADATAAVTARRRAAAGMLR